MEDFVKEFYPGVFEEYQRYCKRDILPQVGQKVVDLNRYGNWNKDKLTVININDEVMELKSEHHGVFVVKIKDWWRYLRIVTK